jgi:hypothetical protein
MPKDEKGREVTGIPPSSIVDGGMQSYGNKTTGVSEELEAAIFGDDDGDADVQETPPAQQPETPTPAPVKPAQQPSAPAATKQDDIPDKYEVELDEEDEPSKETADVKTSEPGEEQQQSDVKEVLPPTDSEVEIEQKEYDYLKTLDNDQLIARMVSHRKGKATVQSRLDKLKNVVGESFIQAVDAGQDLRGASRLLSDLAHPEFQDHLTEFYASHELKNGKYVRTKESAPPAPSVLARYTELLTKQAELNPMQYMDKDTDFDANEALARPASPSGRAWSKYEGEKLKIQREIDAILQQSAEVGTPSPDKTREAAEVLHTQWQKNKELQDQDKVTAFKQFVEEYRNRPLEAFLLAFRQANNGKANTIRLVMKELDRVSANKSAPVTTSQKVQSGNSKHKIKIPNNIRREDIAAVIKDNEVFGDIL